MSDPGLNCLFSKKGEERGVLAILLVLSLDFSRRYRVVFCQTLFMMLVMKITSPFAFQYLHLESLFQSMVPRPICIQGRTHALKNIADDLCYIKKKPLNPLRYVMATYALQLLDAWGPIVYLPGAFLVMWMLTRPRGLRHVVLFSCICSVLGSGIRSLSTVSPGASWSVVCLHLQDRY